MNLFGTPLSAAVAAFLFAGSPSSPDDVGRWQQSLSDAREISAEAAGAAASGKNEEAVRLYEDAMVFGRKAALALHEHGRSVEGDAVDSDSSSDNIDEESPLDWLIALYRNSALTRIRLDDVEGARKDAWGACLYSQNTDVVSLECLAKVCDAGGDDMGQLMALKNIIQLDNNKPSGSKKLDPQRRNEIESAIEDLEEKLKA